MTDENALGPRLRRLEQILSRLEREELELEDALALFESGVAELREAQKVIAHTELRVERLLQDADGVVRETVTDLES
ncbi:MAG: exodeoxyribonuclease VII small subunit [Longimicrobiales bacterium]